MVARSNDVYFLQFNHRGPYSGFKCNAAIDKSLCDGKLCSIFKCANKLFIFYFSYFTEINALNIVEHLDDLQYLFTSENIPRILDAASVDGQIVEKFTKLLYSFAKYGYAVFI